MLIEKLTHRFWVAFRELAQRPGHRLHYHIVSIPNQRVANFKRARSVAATPTSFAVQRHGAHQCCATPPSILRMRPAMNELVGNLMLAPRGPREVASKHINCAPTVDAAAKPFKFLCAQACESRRVFADQLVCNKAMFNRWAVHKSERCVDDDPRRCLREARRELAANGSYIVRLQIWQQANARCDLSRELVSVLNRPRLRHRLSHTPLPDSVRDFLVECVT